MLAENSLCAFDQAGEMVRDNVGHPAYACMCGNILSGRFDPSKPFFTRRGSFWSSCTTELLASTTDEERQAKTRNRCNGEGYESVALVPLRSHGETFGLFQFNDRRRGRFTAEKIARYEDLVAYVAIALAKLRVDEALRSQASSAGQVINSAEEGIIIYDRDMRYQVWNPFMEKLSRQEGWRGDRQASRGNLSISARNGGYRKYPEGFVRSDACLCRLSLPIAPNRPYMLDFGHLRAVKEHERGDHRRHRDGA